MPSGHATAQDGSQTSPERPVPEGWYYGPSAEGSEKKGILSDIFGRPESLPVVLFILFFTILYGAGPELRSAKYVFEPSWLLFTLNAIFITGLGVLIAWLCFRSFLRGGFLNILLLGCGVLAFGLSSFVAGWLIRPPTA